MQHIAYTPPIQTLMEGIPRNFEVFDPLDFLAQVTQHILNKGEHQIRYYRWYSNKKRGMQEKKVAAPGQPEPDTTFKRKCLYFSLEPNKARMMKARERMKR